MQKIKQRSKINFKQRYVAAGGGHGGEGRRKESSTSDLCFGRETTFKTGASKLQFISKG